MQNQYNSFTSTYTLTEGGIVPLKTDIYMARFTQQQRNKARDRFLAEHLDVKKHIDSTTEECGNSCNNSLKDYRSLETMLAIDDYAEKNRLNDHELFLHYIADSAEEFQRLLAKWRAMIADIDPLKFPVR